MAQQLMAYSLTFICLCGFLLLLSNARAEPQKQEEQEKWVVYYGDSEPSEAFMPYQLIVFDSQNHPPLRPLMNRGKTLLGYISLGEIEASHPEFERFKALGVVLEENPNWPERYIVDIRHPQWAKYLIEMRIPAILHRKFDGLMMDTLDSPLHLQAREPRKYAGMQEAAIELVRAIRWNYPTTALMVNRGFEILPSLARYVDSVLAESTLVQVDMKEKQHQFLPEADQEQYLAALEAAREVSPQLAVYSLDYWPLEQEEKVKKIYQIQREQGLIPYVSTLELTAHSKEPE